MLNSNQQRKLFSLRNMFSTTGTSGSAKEDLKIQVENEENHLLKAGEVDQSDKSIA